MAWSGIYLILKYSLLQAWSPCQSVIKRPISGLHVKPQTTNCCIESQSAEKRLGTCCRNHEWVHLLAWSSVALVYFHIRMFGGSSSLSFFASNKWIENFLGQKAKPKLKNYFRFSTDSVEPSNFRTVLVFILTARLPSYLAITDISQLKLCLFLAKGIRFATTKRRWPLRRENHPVAHQKFLFSCYLYSGMHVFSEGKDSEGYRNSWPNKILKLEVAVQFTLMCDHHTIYMFLRLMKPPWSWAVIFPVTRGPLCKAFAVKGFFPFIFFYSDD